MLSKRSHNITKRAKRSNLLREQAFRPYQFPLNSGPYPLMEKIAYGRVDIAYDHKTESNPHGPREQINRYKVETHNQNTIRYRFCY